MANMRGALIQNKTNADLKAKLYPYRHQHRSWNEVCEINRGEERYVWWKGSERRVNNIQASREDFWIDILYLVDGNKLAAIERNIHCVDMVTVTVTGLSEGDVTVTRIPGHELAHNEQLQLVARQATILDEFEEKDNYFDTLGVSYDATEDEIKIAFRTQILRYHPDKFYGNEIDRIAATAITQRLVDAYHYLMDGERRRTHRRFVIGKMGIFSKGRWKAWIQAFERDRKGFLLQTLMSTITIGSGIAVSVLTAGLGTIPFTIGSGLVAGALVGGGANSLFSLFGHETIADGIDYNRYGKRFLAGAAAGAVGGAATAGITAGIVGVGANATTSVTRQLVSASLGSSVDAVAFTVSNGLIAGDFEGKSLHCVCLEVAGTAVIGAAAGGVLVGADRLLGKLAPFANVADEAAATPLAKLGQKAVKKAEKVVPKLAKGVVSGLQGPYRSKVDKLFQQEESEDNREQTTQDLELLQ